MDKKILIGTVALIILLIVSYYVIHPSTSTIKANGNPIEKKVSSIINQQKIKKSENKGEKELKEIYLAGGCFWGLEEYFSRINGVEDAVSGYANGKVETTNYQLIHDTDHAETVKITYDAKVVSLREILLYYFRVIDPLSVNKQGNDVGRQYRTGIYYQDDDDKEIVEQVVAEKEEQLGKKVAIERENLRNFVVAEDYHQDYLKKNPNGYCHIDVNKANDPVIDPSLFPLPDDETLKKTLTKEQYAVTRENRTEIAFSNKYWDNHEAGIYVDVATGEPLFSSKDKFDSGCGWPSFTRPIAKDVIKYYQDKSHGMERIEVRSRSGNAHLGHVFTDGPQEQGGLRYCINSAALRFIKKEEMEETGYGYLLSYMR